MLEIFRWANQQPEYLQAIVGLAIAVAFWYGVRYVIESFLRKRR